MYYSYYILYNVFLSYFVEIGKRVFVFLFLFFFSNVSWLEPKPLGELLWLISSLSWFLLRDHIFHPVFIKIVQDVYYYDNKVIFLVGSSGVKTGSLGQICKPHFSFNYLQTCSWCLYSFYLGQIQNLVIWDQSVSH